MKPEDLIGKRVTEVLTGGQVYGSRIGSYLSFSLKFDDGTTAYARIDNAYHPIQVQLVTLSAEDQAQAKARK